MRALALAFALAACGGTEELAPDGGAPRPDAPPGCTRPALDAPWLAASLGTWMGQLAAAPRATETERAAARAYLTAQLADLGWTPRQHTYPGGVNVYAEIPATNVNPVIPAGVVVGAHFDTVADSPGANDNASGAAVVLAVARYLAETPCRTTPVTLAFFDQEEAGLFGARAFAQMLDPGAIAAVHTIDQVAWDGDGDRRFELELPTPDLEVAWRTAATALGVTLVTTTTGGTDHEAFRAQGFAAVGLTEEYVGGDTSPHRHTRGDTPATVDAAYLGLAARLTAQVVLDVVAP